MEKAKDVDEFLNKFGTERIKEILKGWYIICKPKIKQELSSTKCRFCKTENLKRYKIVLNMEFSLTKF